MNIRRELRIINEELFNAQLNQHVTKEMIDSWSMAIEMILLTMEEEE